MIPENWAEKPPPPFLPFCHGLGSRHTGRIPNVPILQIHTQIPPIRISSIGYQLYQKRQKWGGGGGGGFSAQFSGIIILNLKVYLGDQLCSKYTKKSFVSYSVNEI